MSSRENQVFNLLLIDSYVLKKKLQSKKRKEKEVYRLSLAKKIV